MSGGRRRPVAGWGVAVVLAWLVCVSPAAAAEFVIVNADTAGEGLNDPTPAVPVGGNPGTTLGEQRRLVVEWAADILGQLLPSDVQIRVRVSFDPQTCGYEGALAGSAGPLSVHRDFTGAGFADTWYPQSLANKQAGVDLAPGLDDIRARFNRSLDDPVCLGPEGWYYGFDGEAGPNVDLVPVVLHELAHGLGFTSLVSLADGSGFDGSLDIYSSFLRDESTGQRWTMMTDAERLASTTRTGALAWDGDAVRVKTPVFLAPQPFLDVLSPPALAGRYPVGYAEFGGAYGDPGTDGTLAVVDDGVFVATDACEPLVNGAAVAGKMALVDRGGCDYVAKAQHVQAAGAIGMVIVDYHTAPVPPVIDGHDGGIVIPMVGVLQSFGATLKAHGGPIVVRIGRLPGRYLGASEGGRVLVHAPAPVQSGSSISHFDPGAFPDLLMEPAITDHVHDGLDLVRYVFEDLGWLPRTTEVLEGDPAAPHEFLAAPNPFREVTRIHFHLPRAGLAEIAVYDLAGRRVARLSGGWLPAGEHTLAWDGAAGDGRRLPAGVYLCRVRSGAGDWTRRLVLID
jgi:hypothetical protein